VGALRGEAEVQKMQEQFFLLLEERLIPLLFSCSSFPINTDYLIQVLIPVPLLNRYRASVESMIIKRTMITKASVILISEIPSMP